MLAAPGKLAMERSAEGGKFTGAVTGRQFQCDWLSVGLALNRGLVLRKCSGGQIAAKSSEYISTCSLQRWDTRAQEGPRKLPRVTQLAICRVRESDPAPVLDNLGLAGCRNCRSM